MSKILHSDADVRNLVKEGIFNALVYKKIQEDYDIEQFVIEAQKLIADIPADALRAMIGETIRSFSYGRKPINILQLVELYHNSSQNRTP